ncbi:hypothetical protein F0562_014506 [Nyssa sinensis]|uniref:Uncharacterized protein n=1 Tax=Nyssa sinensis TaxID=561372 RepID=A0A5J4ZP20_9ASTE|nr:hypothetical protein F0562_014506 [Nyssa sinensis]
MEPVKIDWKTINSVFFEDDFYERINAPQWVDLSAPEESVDDESWFCRPDCNHPKTVKDFLKGTSNSKRSGSVSEIFPLGDRNLRDANLKRRGLTQSSSSSSSSSKDSKCDRYVEDAENQNPNVYTKSHQYNAMKAAIKSSTEKKQIDNFSQKEEMSQLQRTLSARNLFAGRDILNQITEFCNELKRMAITANERENVERLNEKKSPMAAKKQEAKECSGDILGNLTDGEKERKPLLEVSIEKCEAMEKSNVKEKQRWKRTDEAENIPISVDLKNVKKHKEMQSLLQIRTCPPSPQCFSADRGPTSATTPLKVSRSRPPERGILQEREQSHKEVQIEESGDKGNSGRTTSIVAEREARTLDRFLVLETLHTFQLK